MKYTQIEITSPDKEVEVWWIPIPEAKAKVGEKINREIYEGQGFSRTEEWTVTQVCITLDGEDIPEYANIADQFKWKPSVAFMSI